VEQKITEKAWLMGPESQDKTSPRLTFALLAYMIIFLLTVGILSLTANNIETSLVRFLAALLFAGLGTFIAMQIDRAPFRLLWAGIKPRLLVLGLLMGLLLWVPAFWMIFSANYLLDTSVGLNLQGVARAVQSVNLSPAASLQIGVVVPVLYGVFLFGYVQAAATSALGKNGGALLTAVAFAMLGYVINVEYGMSALPATVLVGAFAAFAVRYTESPWAGIACFIGFSMILPVFGAQADSVLGFLGGGEQLFQPRWLLAAAFGIFLAFAVLQILRVVQVGQKPALKAKASLVWPLPLLVVVVLVGVLCYGEYALRRQSPMVRPPAPPGSTIVPQ
jgi:hypothetical protein